MGVLNLLETDLETTRKIIKLVAKEYLTLLEVNPETGQWETGIFPVVFCNNFFIDGKDAEPLNIEDVDKLIEIVTKWPLAGHIAWVSIKRKGFSHHRTAKREWLREYKLALKDLMGNECVKKI